MGVGVSAVQALEEARERGNERPARGNWAKGIWTDERVVKLKELWLKGSSASEIGTEMGISRCAVLGKVNRIGLSGRQPVRPLRDPARKARRDKPKLRIIRSIEREALKIRAAEVEARHLPEPEPGLCKYPYGDGPFTFCGHPIQDKSSYCGPHHALCWMPPKERAHG